MKIAVLGQYPLDLQRLKGIEVATIYAQRELLKVADLELHIITCKSELTQPQRVEQGRLTITYLPQPRFSRLTWHYRDIRAIHAALRVVQPDLVHGHGTGFYAGAALSSPYPSLITVHGITAQEAKYLIGGANRLRGALDSEYERWVVRRARHLMLISPYVEQVFGGLFRGCSYLVEAACDERFFSLERQVVPGRLLFTGLLVKRKGILPLLQALALVRRERPEAHLHLVGPLGAQPDYVLTCEEYAHAAGLDDAVTFLGHIPQEQLYQEYAQCAALVLPSFQETAPSVIQQAMACGAPCVALRAGGVPWMLEDGVTGLTLPVPPTMEGDPPALAAAILRLLNDPAGAQAMGARARLEARRRFWPADVARRTVDVYRQVINS